jgi:hypothetical protein
MLRLAAAALVFAAMASPAMSQTGSPAGAGQVTGPSGPNSGAGIAGHPGNKSGPAVRPPSATSGAGTSTSPESPAMQDASKIPGQPGNKSGPAPNRQPSPTGR